MEEMICKKTKTIVYLHGYGSTGLSCTGEYLAKKLPQYRILTPDIPVDPAEALPFLSTRSFPSGSYSEATLPPRL